MDIEEVARRSPEKIVTFQIEPAAGFQPYVGRNIAAAAELDGDLSKQCGRWSEGLHGAFLGRT